MDEFVPCGLDTLANKMAAVLPHRRLSRITEAQYFMTAHTFGAFLVAIDNPENPGLSYGTRWSNIRTGEAYVYW